jgi:phenylacetyl-CoA:acceptor oxidoreductase 26-kDa subunit
MSGYGPSPWLQRHWDARAAANFIGGGFGSGLLVAAAIAHASGLPWRAALVTGLASMAIGLVSVWFEIGRPLRARNVFINARTSWMTREAMAAVTVFAIAAVALVTGLHWAAWLTALSALAFVWCQARMLRAARGIPAWRHPAIVPLTVVSALADGAALYALLSLALPAATPGAAGWLAAALALLAVLRWGVWQHYRSRVGAAATLPLRRALDRIGRVQNVATAVAAALAAAATFAAPSMVAAVLTGCAALSIAVAGAWLRYALIRRAAFNQGFALPTLPVRGAAHVRNAAATAASRAATARTVAEAVVLRGDA